MLSVTIVYAILLTLFLVGNKRWQDRMDADMAQASLQWRQQQHAQTGRKYGH